MKTRAGDVGQFREGSVVVEYGRDHSTTHLWRIREVTRTAYVTSDGQRWSRRTLRPLPRGSKTDNRQLRAATPDEELRWLVLLIVGRTKLRHLGSCKLQSVYELIKQESWSDAKVA